jgi:RecA-family ATPase
MTGAEHFHTVAIEDWSDTMPSLAALGRTYPEPEQFVDGFLTVGLSIVSATPKAGKTWLVHECAVGVATGSSALGVLSCLQSEVLCIFLEDSERRGILRERVLMGHAGGCPGITYAWVGSAWNLDRLGRWLDAHPKCRVVIIDTAERWKQMQPAVESSGRVYSDDYRFWGELQSFAIRRNIALIIVHHDRKPNGNGGNVLDTVSGTRAITGAADHVWVLDRNADTGISTLKVVGRDLDERSIRFNRGIDGKLRAVEQPVLDSVARMDQRARARAMRDDGMSFAAIGKTLGVSKSTAENWCKDADQGRSGK